VCHSALRTLLAVVLLLGGLFAAVPVSQAPLAELSPSAPALPGEATLASRDGRRSDVEATNTALAAPHQGRLLALSDAEAWRRLPAAVRGAGQPLPGWARTLAASLPYTTAAMLELDYHHRCGSQLPPRLRAELRWVAAHANQCAYGEAYATADLRNLGLEEAQVRALAGAGADLDEADQAALAFARKLTLAADTVTDADVARLVKRYGEKQVVAMVLLLAYANFQDRLVHALDLPVEPGGPLPPLDVQFTERPLWIGRTAARLPQTTAPSLAGLRRKNADMERGTLDCTGLSGELEKQRRRQPRIPLPPHQPGQVHWGLLCRTYQPELAARWSACDHAFNAEADQDPVLEQSVFWVVTHAVRCFY
jgi:alkylhydroperoxidase family enzyme